MRSLLLLLTFLVATPALRAQDANDALYDTGMHHSQVMNLLHNLTDVYGPRLTGSPSLARAGNWALETMEGWGMTNPQRVAWDWGHAGWENERLSVHIVEPTKDALVAEVLGWTPSTNGAQTGPVVHLKLPENPTMAQMSTFEDSVRALVRGAVVLVGETGIRAAMANVPPMRLTDEDARARFTPQPAGDQNNRGYTPPSPGAEGRLASWQVAARMDSVLLADGALVRVNPAGMDNGLIRAFANRSFDPSTVAPTLVMRDEDFGRLSRLIAAGHTPRVEVEIKNTVYPDAQTEHNYTAEIPGTDLADEVVMMGGHLDSWHSATGATDNAAGSAVMMEAARILQNYFETTGTRPRRTIRVALWTGEEQGLLGSRAYVQQTFGSFEEPTDAYDDFAGYFNVDSGTGRLRGAVVFGPTEAAEMLDAILDPLDSLGVAGARPTFSRGIGGSDHTAFNNAGLPGISMGQDPIQYFTTTWHTNVDTYERLLEDDLKQAAVTVATAVYHLATQDEQLPRFAPEEMPAVPLSRR